MKANEIIRSVIDLIDHIDSGGIPSIDISINSTPVDISPTTDVKNDSEEFENDDIRRFKQIIDLLNTGGNNSPFSNSPNEMYADINAVTKDAGGGMNNPKHPSDQRVQHPSLYPGYQTTGG